MTNDKNEFILEEYKNAAQLTYHIDSLRNKVTSFFLSFAGVISALLFIVIEDKLKNSDFNIPATVFCISFFVTIIGLITICISAKLRSVQLEHFTIINNVREHFVPTHEEENNAIRKLLILNSSTLPNAKLFTGTYYWVLLIIFTTSTIFATGIYFMLNMLESELIKVVISIIGFLMIVFLSNAVYFYLASYPRMPIAKTMKRIVKDLK